MRKVRKEIFVCHLFPKKEPYLEHHEDILEFISMKTVKQGRKKLYALFKEVSCSSFLGPVSFSFPLLIFTCLIYHSLHVAPGFCSNAWKIIIHLVSYWWILYGVMSNEISYITHHIIFSTLRMVLKVHMIFFTIDKVYMIS